MSSLVLDAGALIAIDHDERAVLANVRVAQRNGRKLRTTSVVVAQVWRDAAGRQAMLARFLKAVEVVAIDEQEGRKIGLILATSATNDVVDGSVALISRTGDWIATSDPGEINHLLQSIGVVATVVAC